MICIKEIHDALKTKTETLKVRRSDSASAEELLAKLDTGDNSARAEALNAKDEFDVLIVGGGPAGAAAAVYAGKTGGAGGQSG